MDEEEYSLTNDEDFWYKMGVDYEEISKKDGNLLSNLINSFTSKGKKRQLSKKISLEKMEDLKPNLELKNKIFGAHTEWLWDKNRTGFVFESTDKGKFEQTFSNDKNNKVIVEKVGDFRILWKINAELGIEGDSNLSEVHGRKFLRADSSLIKTNEKRKTFEIRGRKSFINELRKSKLTTKNFKELKPTIRKEKVIIGLDNFSDKDKKSLFTITKVKFRETNLPNKSWLTIDNKEDKSIIPDIESLNEFVNFNSFSNIKEIIVKSLDTGKKIKITMIHRDKDFEFSIQDNDMDDKERNKTKTLLSSLFGIDFNTPYDYKSQSDEKFIFNKILEGSVIAYEKYHKGLRDAVKDILNKIVTLTTKNFLSCSNCKKEFPEGEKVCSCGSESFDKLSHRVIEINEEEVFRLIFEKLNNLKGGKSYLDFKDFSYEKIELKPDEKKKRINLSLFRNDKSDRVSISRKKTIIIKPISIGRIPKEANDYLNSYGFVGYGASYENKKRFSYFGYLDLYSLLFEGKKEHLKTLVENSINGIDERNSTLAKDAEENLSKNNYDGNSKDFERDVFYLLKRMVPLTERWGRIGKRESDGLILFDFGDDDYFISSYDPKLSESEYKLDSEEQNKAIFYVLDETHLKEIKLLKKKESLDIHILVSNKFSKNKLKGYIKGIKKWYGLLKKHSGKEFDVPVLFLEIPNLLELYRIYKEDLPFIKGFPEVNKVFLESLKDSILNKKNNLFEKGDVDKIKENLLQKIDAIKYKQNIK